MEKKNKKNEENKNNKKNEINPYCDINYLKGLGDFFIEDDDNINDYDDDDENDDINDINIDMDDDDNISDININDDVDEDVDEDDEDDNYIEEDTKKKRKRKKKNEDECKYMIRNNEYSYAEACKRTLYWREKTQSWAGRKAGDIYDTKEEAEKVMAKVSQLPNGKSGQCEERDLRIVQVAADFASKRGAYYIEGRHHPCAKQKVRDRSRTIAKQKAWEDELTTYTPRFDPLDGSYIGE